MHEAHASVHVQARGLHAVQDGGVQTAEASSLWGSKHCTPTTLKSITSKITGFKFKKGYQESH